MRYEQREAWLIIPKEAIYYNYECKQEFEERCAYMC